MNKKKKIEQNLFVFAGYENMAGCLENHPILLLSLSFLPRNNAVIKVNEARGRKTQKSEKPSFFPSFFLSFSPTHTDK